MDSLLGATMIHDGAIDYSRYSSSDLEDVLGRIDAGKNPLNYQNLVAELERRGLHPGHEMATVWEARWRNLRVRRAALAASVLGFAVIPFALAFLVAEDSVVPFVAAAVLLGIGCAVGFWHHRFRCPSCDELFFRREDFQNPFANRCLHCGTRVGS